MTLKHFILFVVLTYFVVAFDYDDPVIRCFEGIPSSLSFVEPLYEGLQQWEIVIFSGGHSVERRQSGYAKLSADSIERWARHQGYRNVFLDQLEYDRSLRFGDVTYSGHWHRVFAMPALRRRFPDSKYFVWLDDDILVPYYETNMLNYYINYMEESEFRHMLYGREGSGFVLNSGMFIMKNSDFAFSVYEEAKLLGLADGAHLAHNFAHEQGAIIRVRDTNRYYDEIVVLPHRDGRYNFNTFARDALQDTPETRSMYGDAFVHFTGQDSVTRESKMGALIKEVGEWRKSVLPFCKYPMEMSFYY